MVNNIKRSCILESWCCIWLKLVLPMAKISIAYQNIQCGAYCWCGNVGLLYSLIVHWGQWTALVWGWGLNVKKIKNQKKNYILKTSKKIEKLKKLYIAMSQI